jgi:hypothetical protein
MLKRDARDVETRLGTRGEAMSQAFSALQAASEQTRTGTSGGSAALERGKPTCPLTETPECREPKALGLAAQEAHGGRPRSKRVPSRAG